MKNLGENVEIFCDLFIYFFTFWGGGKVALSVGKCKNKNSAHACSPSLDSVGSRHPQ